MRCSCQVCGTYMTQSEGLEKVCVCPNLLTRCNQCLGTDSVVPRDQLKQAAMLFLMKARKEEEGADEADERDPYRD